MISKQNKASQYEFKILLKSVIIEYGSTFNFKIIIKKGNKQFETKNNYKYESPSQKEININEEIVIPSTLISNENKFKDKVYKLYLQVYTKQGFKSATFSDLNFHEFIDYNYQEVIVNFKKHPFTNLKLNTLVQTKFLEDIDLNENPNDISKLSDGEDEMNISMVSRKEETDSTKITNTTTDKNEQNSDKIIKELKDKIEILEKEKKDSHENKGNIGNIRQIEELKDKDRIINELKLENEYYADETTQLKSIIDDLKSEKSKVYEEKMKVIKELKEQIEELKENLSNAEKTINSKNKIINDITDKNNNVSILIEESNQKYEKLEYN